MKNKEKHLKEIVEIACDGNCIAVDKNSGKVKPCCYSSCSNCLFDDSHYRDSDCDRTRRKWAESEYVEHPVISKSDRTFLEYLREEHKFIARDENGELFTYETQPKKVNACWNSVGLIHERYLHLNRHFNIDFPMIKWSDEEPWLIEDLKKLEVVDSYE